MPSVVGIIDEDLCFDVFADLNGPTQGIGLPFGQWVYGVDGGLPNLQDWDLTLEAVGVATADGGSGATKLAATGIAGVDEADATSYGLDWYDKVHILPRVEIEFGNIITLVEEDFEIYNAHRSQSATIVGIVNGATPGVELPDTPISSVIEPQTSILRSTSTDNTGGSGLGTMVLTRVQAEQNGLPRFDTSILFDIGSPLNDVQLFISGSRIVLIPFEYEVEAEESLSFVTDIMEAQDGKEQRVALVDNPKEGFSFLYKLEGIERQRMHARLFSWMGNVFGQALWHRKVELTAAVSSGSTNYPILGGDEVEFRVGGLAAVILDSNTYDVIQISSVSDTLLVAEDESINSYPAGTSIMPVRQVILPGRVNTLRHFVNLEEFRLETESVENDVGAMTGSTTPGFWSTYNSRVLFDDCNVLSSPARTELFQKVHKVDNSIGKPSISSGWNHSKRGMPKNFYLRSRAEILLLRRLFVALKGRQKPFYIPSFIEDLLPADDLAIGVDTIDVVSVEYTRLLQDLFPMTIFRITFTDGTSLVREVQSSAVVSEDVDRLTLDTTWPANRTVDEVQRIEFYDLVRFANDRMTLRYPMKARARCNMTVVRVFDDN